MPYSDAELEALFLSTDIDLDDLDLDGEEEETPELPTERSPKTHRLMKFKVPVEDADKVQAIIERVMAEEGFEDDDALANAGDALVHIIGWGTA